MTLKKLWATAIIAVLLSAGCSLITDFDDAAEKYSLDENLTGTVSVTLSSVADTGSLNMQFTEALPEGDDAALLALLDEGDSGTGAVVGLTVARDDTGTSYSLTSGARVTSTPAAPGEYSLSLSEDRMSIQVSFYNEYAGTMLDSAFEYTATIEVAANNSYFRVEYFTRTVTVSGG